MIGIINNILNKQWTHAISPGSFTKQLTSVYFKGAIIRLFGNPPLICALLLSLKRIKDWYLKQNENRLLLRGNINAELQLLKATGLLQKESISFSQKIWEPGNTLPYTRLLN